MVTVLGLVLCLLTECLSVLDLVQRTTLIIAWFMVGIVTVVGIASHRTQIKLPRERPDPIVLICIVGCTVIAAVTLLLAIVSPPNSADAMAYHMPRVIYWAEQSSVRFFPTHYLNQIMLQPFAEYVSLHLYLLSGADHLVNLIQWFASVISIVAVSQAAGYFGANSRGQAISALFCATLPAGILASSGAKNDYVLAMWIVIAVCFAFRFASTSRLTDAFFLGAACGLALLTKGTAYVFLPWLICAVLIARWRTSLRRACAGAATIAACAAVINAPHFIRNYELSGSILGFDSAHADGFFRWRNETLGWKQTLSNVVRNASEQLGARSERWNHGVYNVALSIHRTLGIDPNDPSTTWRWTAYEPPKNANHEANAPNRWHLLALIAIAALYRRGALYASALLVGFLLFCAYLKWQPFMSRLILPLFVAASPLAGAFDAIRPPKLALIFQGLLCLLLLDGARLPLTQNWIRPLHGSASVLKTPRSEQYFADMSPWQNKDSFVRSADLIARTGCDRVGIDMNNFQIEYPLIALLRERRPSTRFIHTGVTNPSTRYRPSVQTMACVVACLDCVGDQSRLSLYKSFPKSESFGRFVVFLK